VQKVLLDLTDTPNVSSTWVLLQENIRRWSELLATLVQEIHQKGRASEGSDKVDGADKVFFVLALGTEETISWLHDVRDDPKSQTSHAVEQLNARVILHAESMKLMSAHLKR
jgi:hypothetical protein